MPHDGERADAPARWLANAVADLVEATLTKSGSYRGVALQEAHMRYYRSFLPVCVAAIIQRQ